jgi:hypothetical protein
MPCDIYTVIRYAKVDLSPVNEYLDEKSIQNLKNTFEKYEHLYCIGVLLRKMC